MRYLVQPMDPISFCDQRVALGSHSVFVRRWQAVESGSAQAPLLLFHESLGCTTMWRDFPSQLCAATGRAVIAYDRIGYGQSTPSRRPPNRSFITDEAEGTVAPLLEALQVDRFIGFGHSTGGSMALAAAAQLGKRCVGVVSESGHAFVENCTRRGVEAARLRFQDPAQFGRLERHHGCRARWVLDTWIETWLSPWFDDWNLDQLLTQIACPILLLHGSKDPYGTIDQAHHVSALANGPTTLVSMHDCGHTPHLEDPAGTTSHSTHFVDQLRFQS